ncbi:peptidoglycan-recognition protein 2-like [Venturia canescens]|uniref:peptidoglycan-recognition protein 2-like n=1 Tax=Venturia canescens TaxID=32260 RepID=UPI001C9CA9BB|nr:peptidoglycan-recognition protein 2-like [Venturia canescens]
MLKPINTMLCRIFFLLISTVIFPIFAENNGNCPNVLNRSAWGGQQSKGVSYLIVPLQYVTIHHTVTPNCLTFNSCSERVRNIQSYQMDELHWDDIGFSFLIGGDGNIYEGVGWAKEGAHTYGWNKKSAGIAFIGNFQETEPPRQMMEAARKLIDCGKSGEFLKNDVKILGARQLVSTLSPGDKLYEKIQHWSDWVTSP